MNALPLAADVVYRSGGWFGPSTIGLIIVLAIIGAILYFGRGKIDPPIRTCLIVVAVVLTGLWLLLLVLRVTGTEL